MCGLTPSSAETSPMVRVAPSALPEEVTGSATGHDPFLHDLAGAEGQHAARSDRNLAPGLGVAPGAPALVAQQKGAEARNLHILAALESVGHVVEHRFLLLRRIGARQSYLVVDRIGQISPGQSTH